MKLDDLDEKLNRIAKAVGVPDEQYANNDEEDRKRLKEKLKEVLEIAQRNRIRKITSEKERWLEYVFGICRPDGRIGKRGSRYAMPNSFMYSIIYALTMQSWRGSGCHLTFFL